VQWLKDHPRFLKNPLYIMGDSYSGIIIPILVQQISDGIYEHHLLDSRFNSIFPKKKKKRTKEQNIDVIYNDGFNSLQL
jgi:hypothetical protein